MARTSSLAHRTETRSAPNREQRRHPERFASVAAAAEYADVSTKSIRRWIASGLIPGYRIGPRLLKVDLNDLDRLARRIPTAGDGDAA